MSQKTKRKDKKKLNVNLEKKILRFFFFGFFLNEMNYFYFTQMTEHCDSFTNPITAAYTQPKMFVMVFHIFHPHRRPN